MIKSCRFRGFTVTALAAWGLLMLARPARTQDSQGQSVAEAARRARQDKKTSKPASRASKILTDDDLSRAAKSAEGVNVGAPPKLETQSPSESAVAATEAADQIA